MNKRIVIETRRLTIVNFHSNDVDSLHQLTGNKDVMRFFPKVLTFEETGQMLQAIKDQYFKYGHCFWKALSTETGEFVGIAGLLHQEIDGQVETEVAYRLLPQYWNKGYATEAAGACKTYAENALKKKRLVSIIHPENTASARVAQKLGAMKEKSILFIGKEHDVYVY